MKVIQTTFINPPYRFFINNLIFFSIVSIFVLTPLVVQSQDILGSSLEFSIEPVYDSSGREELTATLQKISQKVYWYTDDQWWEGLTEEEVEAATESLDDLALEFDAKIYPVLTGNFGSEWNPGIDNDSRITILVHPMVSEAGGYFNSADEYSKLQIPESNEREMVYFNAIHLTTDFAKSFLAHEFQHLISFNQKEKTFNVSEDVWLNESRSEYVPTLLGYNQGLEANTIERRIRNFLDKPYDSLTEWKNVPYDYGVASLFIHYLVDHYGKNILINSLKSARTGIDSLNYALARAGFREDFAQIFTDWAITVLVNDCSVSMKYCYFDENLASLKLAPFINYLPPMGKSVLSVTDSTKDWSGNWHKFIGGNHRTLNIEFSGSPAGNFKIPYVIQNNQGHYLINFLELDANQEGIIEVTEFGSINTSLTIIPILQGKTSGFSNLEPSVSFFWSASTVEETNPEEEALISQLLAQIAELQKQITIIQARINEILGISSETCQGIDDNLYFGMRNDARVKCLQEFLKSQNTDIYPEGLVTGNFLSLTKAAVIRFQEKYKEEILIPLGLKEGTGFVGPMTRTKINQLLAY